MSGAAGRREETDQQNGDTNHRRISVLFHHRSFAESRRFSD